MASVTSFDHENVPYEYFAKYDFLILKSVSSTCASNMMWLSFPQKIKSKCFDLMF